MFRQIALAVLVSASTASAQPELVFTDITDANGLAFTNLLTESLCWGDYDNDGDSDLYLTHQPGMNSLHRNDGNGNFTDVSAEVGVGRGGWGVGCAFGDLDNDGDLDLYVVQFNPGASDILLRNEGPVGPGGGYVFTDISEQAGITFIRSSRGVALLDYDRDSLLDIYVNAIGPDLVYHNLGNLEFEEVAHDIGVTGVAGQGVGVVATDVDDDGWIDLFTGNRSSDINRLFINQRDGSFIDVSPSAGISKVGFGMGVHSFDFDNDLDMDLYWTSWPTVSNALYENLDGDGLRFADISAPSRTRNTNGWGISNNAGDIDSDGWEDFFVTNGFSNTTAPNALFHNNGDGSFSNLQTAIPGGLNFDGRGVAFADIDNDGDVDLIVTADAGEPNKLWRNDTPTSNSWLTVSLTGRASNRSGIGARIEVKTDLGTTVKEVSGGAGRGSQNDLPVEFGLGQATEVRRVTVLWPSGAIQELWDVGIDERIEVVENSPPDCEAAVAFPARLWPPNRRMVEVEIQDVAVDPDLDTTIRIESVSQDEPTGHRRHTCPDATHLEDSRVLLRAQRRGGGRGRVYQIDFSAEDNFGGSCAGQVTVCVKHDAASDCIADEMVHDSTSCDPRAIR